MSKGTGLRQRTVWDLTDALGGSLDLKAMLTDAFGPLLKLVDADYAALATSRWDRANELEWSVRNLPPAFLGSYAEFAQHDFVYRSVRSKIRVVMRDAAMIDRPAMERNLLHQRARDLDSPIEQVMAVMLHASGDLQSGLSLYRARPRPFTDDEQERLQQFTPAIANAVRNCWSSTKEKRWGTLLETLLDSEEHALAVIRIPAQEIKRTATANALLGTWFESAEYGAGFLPRVLLEELAKARVAKAKGRGEPSFWTRAGDEVDLIVEFRPLPEPVGEQFWAVVFREQSHFPPPPVLTNPLTPRECEVASRVLLGWDDKEIAQNLPVPCELGTVKKHVRTVLEKSGAQDRKRFISQVLLGRIRTR